MLVECMTFKIMLGGCLTSILEPLRPLSAGFLVCAFHVELRSIEEYAARVSNVLLLATSISKPCKLKLHQ